MTPHFVTSLEWSERLKKAGVPQVSEFWWVRIPNGYSGEFTWELDTTFRTEKVPTKNKFSAYLSDELAGMLPKSLDIKRAHYWLQIEVQEMQEGWSCQYKNTYRCYKFFENRTMPNALAAMVEYCKQKGLI